MRHRIKKPRRLYTPALSDENVRKLYKHATRLGIPMTRLLGNIVTMALEELEKAGNER